MKKNTNISKLLEYFYTDNRRHKRRLIESDDFEDTDFEDTDFEEPAEPQEEDITISDSRSGGYDVGVVGGEFIGEFEDMDEALKAVKAWKEENKYWPTTWWISDHGNSWPIDDSGNEIK